MTERIDGRYQVLRPLAEGGMARVYLAKQWGAGGFAKLVALKRMQPRLVASERFLEMFLQEGRLAADLRHPNVAQVLEAGRAEGELYLSMEYLEGLDVGRLQQRVVARGDRMPLGVACQIVIDAAAGLAYAHQKLDFDGRPLDIVHRDVSPQNLFVTVDGVTKVLDFGIAKARSHTSFTEVGTIRGKASYMAPEQVRGEPVDARADQFALGVVLWELTTGERLFSRGEDRECLRAVLQHDVRRPSAVVERYPPRLEEIVLRALAAEPGQRFLTCDQLGLALEDLLDDGLFVGDTRVRRGPRACATLVRERLFDVAPTRAEQTLPSHVEPGREHCLEVRSSGSLSEPQPTVPQRRRLTPQPYDPPSDGGAASAAAAAARAALSEGPGVVTVIGPARAAMRLARSLATGLVDDDGPALIDLAGARAAADLPQLLGVALGLAPDALPRDAERAAVVASRTLCARGAGAIVIDATSAPFASPSGAGHDDGLRDALRTSIRRLAEQLRVIVAAARPLEMMGERLVEHRGTDERDSVVGRAQPADVDALAARCRDELARSEAELREGDCRSRLAGLRDQIEVALESLLERPQLPERDMEQALTLALALDVITGAHGATPAQLRMLDELLLHAATGAAPTLVARLHEVRADHDKVAGRLAEAKAGYQAALTLAQDDAALTSIALRNIADVELDERDLASAEIHARAAVAAGRRVGNERLVARATWTLARVALRQGDVAGADVLLEQALSSFRALADARFAARTCFELARCAELRGDYDGARAAFLGALADHDQLADVVFAERARQNLGTLAALVGNLDDARAWLEAARASARLRGDVRAEGYLAGQLGEVARAAGDLSAAELRRAEAQELATLGIHGS